MQLIPISSIALSATNPRKETAPEGIQDLAASIKTQGLLTPIIVRPLPASQTNGHLYELVCGSRRLAAMQLLGVDDIPAVVRDLDDIRAAEVQVVENLQRQDVTPIEEAEAYEYIQKQSPDRTIEEIARRVGKRVEYVARRLSLLRLTEGWRARMKQGLLTLEQALYVCRFAPEDQDMLNEEFAEDEEVRIADLQDLAESHILKEISRAAFDTTIAYDELLPCTLCEKRTGYQSMLFEDMADSDRCLDGGCWDRKTRAHAQNVIARHTAAGVELSVARSYRQQDELAEDLPVIEDYNLRPATEADIEAGRAVTVIDLTVGSATFGRVQTLAPNDGSSIVREKREKAPITAASLRTREQRLNRDVLNRKRIAGARMVYEHLEQHSAETLPESILKVLTPIMIDRMNHDAEKVFLQITGLKLKGDRWDASYKDGVAQYIAGLTTPSRLNAALFAAVVSRDLLATTWSEGNVHLLLAYIDNCKIDTTQACKFIDEEFKPKFERLEKDRAKLAESGELDEDEVLRAEDTPEEYEDEELVEECEM